MPPVFLHSNSQATLSWAYSHIYNGKSRHISLRHSYVRQLLTDGVITIDFVKSVQNLVNSLTKGLARDLVWKTSKEMGLKPLDHQQWKLNSTLKLLRSWVQWAKVHYMLWSQASIFY
jgi:hypothetical protein